MTKKVLFVCMGNICRSPAGEAVMQRFAEEFGVDVEVDSAGTHDYHVGDMAEGFKGLFPDTRSFDGCIDLYATQKKDDPQNFVIVETWETRQKYEK